MVNLSPPAVALLGIDVEVNCSAPFEKKKYICVPSGWAVTGTQVSASELAVTTSFPLLIFQDVSCVHPAS